MGLISHHERRQVVQAFNSRPGKGWAIVELDDVGSDEVAQDDEPEGEETDGDASPLAEPSDCRLGELDEEEIEQQRWRVEIQPAHRGLDRQEIAPVEETGCDEVPGSHVRAEMGEIVDVETVEGCGKLAQIATQRAEGGDV